MTMRLLKICLSFLFFFFPSTNNFAQDYYTLKGYVKDGTSYFPGSWGDVQYYNYVNRNSLSGVRITIDNLKDVYTDRYGYFEISELSKGNHQLNISRIGYQSMTYTTTKEDSVIFLVKNKYCKFGTTGVLYMGRPLYIKTTDGEKVFIKNWREGDLDGNWSLNEYFEICDIYEKGKTHYNNENIKEAIKYFREAANYNHPDASYELGKMYETGNNVVKPDLREALFHYHNAANCDHKEAQKRIDILEGKTSHTRIELELLKREPSTGRRVALIIGNDKYGDSRNLPNVRNDTYMFQKELEDSLNFEVIPRPNRRDLEEMKRAINDFCNIVDDSCEAALFFYSGHGLFVEQTNYLQPTDAHLERTSDKEDIESVCVSLDYVIKKMAKCSAKTNIIMIDACRENEFIGLDKGISTSNIKAVEPPRNFFISFSTMTGEVAYDGLNHSPYMEAMIEALRVPNLPLYEVFHRAKFSTYKLSGEKQSPCIIDTTTGSTPFFFKNIETL